MSFERFHVPIMGFTQSQSRESGLEKLWRELREEIPLSTECLVHPQRWNADFDGLAEFILRNGTSGTRVNIYAYSWGCGHGFVELAEALQKRGIQVPQAVLCDPVYHSWWRPWRGLFPAVWNGPIVAPGNVWHVDSFFQRLNRPQGCSIRLTNRMAKRGTKGWKEPVYQQGKFCGTKRRYSDSLLMFVLKRMDPAFRDTPSQTTVNVGPQTSQKDVQSVISESRRDPNYLKFLRKQGVAADTDTAPEPDLSDLLG